MKPTPPPGPPRQRDELVRRRRALIGTGVAVGLVCLIAFAGLVFVSFSADRQGWNDESRVTQVRGLVVEEVRGAGSCKGADFDTRLEWTQEGEARTAWTATCRSGPDVGDTVDMWVRDDGAVKLTSPGATNVFTVLGGLVFIGLGALTFFSIRSNVRKVNEDLSTL